MNSVKKILIKREDWGAFPHRSPPAPLLANNITKVILHHSNSPNGECGRSAIFRVRNIQHYHKDVANDRKSKWLDIGYHFLISSDGNLFQGRLLKYTGAHTKFYNDVSIGICLLGNFNESTPTKVQLDSLCFLLSELCIYYSISPSEIKGHRDFRNNILNDCPGNNLYNELKKIRCEVEGLIDKKHQQNFRDG